MPVELSYILIFGVLGMILVLALLTLQRLLAPHHPTAVKLETYECGEVAMGKPWVKVHIRYYFYALLYLLFDIEVVFLFPWAVVYQDLGLFGFMEMLVFIAILLVGLIYPWRKHALRWV